MTERFHARAKELFIGACDRPQAERRDFLRQACGDERELLLEVLSLLEFHEEGAISWPGVELTSAERPPERITNYQLEERLGEGGMGEVWRARQVEPVRRTVAIKLVKWGMDTKEVVARFESERQALALMDHANIAKVFEAGTTERGRPFFAMELVHGVPITRYCDEHRLSNHERLKLFLQVCRGVQHAHDQGVIHRDLKPSNVLVTVQDDRPVPKIIDFGVAKATAQRLTERTISTQLGQWIGTPDYMSPEQAEMSGLEIDTRTDVYSLGAVLYELVVGAQPFDAEELWEVGFDEMRRKIREEEPTLPSTKVSGRDDASSVAAKNRRTDLQTLAGELRGDVDSIIMKSLEKDRERRYDSPADLAADIERHLRHEPVLASPSSIFYRIVKFTRRHPFALAVSGMTAAVLLIGLTAAIVGLRALRIDSQANDMPMLQLASHLTQLTSQPGVEAFPTLSPDGQLIAYQSSGAESWDIYLRDLEGGNPINLTAGSPVDEVQPRFSPDGRRIAFRSDRGWGGIFVMDTAGGSVKRVADGGYNPAWSPDGESIVFSTEPVFTSSRSVFDGQLRVVSPDTGKIRDLTDEDRDAVHPDWSPNGHRIAFWAVDQGTRDIWTIAAAGGQPSRLTDDVDIDWNPIWSPDGNYVYFLSDRGGTMGVWRIRVEEETGKALSDPQAVGASAGTELRQLAFMGDGSALVYSSVTAASHIQRVAMTPAMEVDAREAFDIWRGSRTAVSPFISPSGQWVAFCFFSGGGKTRLAVIRPDGTDLRYLTDEPYADFPTGWSPDGSRITFYSNRSGSFEVWTIQPTGSGLRQVTETPDADTFSGPWSPDGSLMAIWSAGRSALIDPRKLWAEQSPTELEAPEVGGSFVATSWRPDGKQLAGNWETPERDGVGKIAYFSLEEQDYEITTVEGGSPIWLEDGRRLLFLKEGKIFLLDSHSGEYSELVSISPGHVDSLGSVSPDNRWIYFSRRLAEADLWHLTLE